MKQRPIVAGIHIPRAGLTRSFGLAAEALRFETNDPALLAAAAASFGRFPVPAETAEPLLIRVFSEAEPGVPLPPTAADAAVRPLVRPGDPAGDHAVFRTSGDTLLIAAGEADVATVDVVRGRALGFVSRTTAGSGPRVRYVFIEAMGLAMLSRARDYLALHAAGVERAGLGLVLQGPAGAGKSTLAIACARRGYSVFAEDVVFTRLTAQGLEAWGMPWIQRLLPDAVELFPELLGHVPRRQSNGEVKIEVDLDSAYPGRASPRAVPSAVVLVERAVDGETLLEAIDRPRPEPLEVHWPWEAGWTEGHERLADAIDGLPRYRLRMAGTPDEAVDALDRLVGEESQAGRAAGAG